VFFASCYLPGSKRLSGSRIPRPVHACFPQPRTTGSTVAHAPRAAAVATRRSLRCPRHSHDAPFVASGILCAKLCSMKHAAGSDGPVSATTPPDVESDGLAQRRLFYAERCENLIQALQFVSAVLRKTPAGGNDIRDARARCLSDRLPPEMLEAEFGRIDATWAAWNRPDTSPRNRESVGRHARMALLAAVDQAAQFIDLSKVTRALARSRAGYALSAEEEALVQNRTEATVAAGLLDGKPHLLKTLCGDVQYVRDEAFTAETAVDAELPQPPELIRWLTEQNGYSDLASKLTDEQADRLVRAWPKHAGRPRGGELANWNVILHILGDLDLGKSANVRKDWEAFRRENGMARPSQSPKPRRRIKPQA
jgi:hypothetical protein